MIQIIYSDHLAHHGVKGMKWGVRRYQNYDGTRISVKKQSTKPKRDYYNRPLVNKDLKISRLSDAEQKDALTYNSYKSERKALEELDTIYKKLGKNSNNVDIFEREIDSDPGYRASIERGKTIYESLSKDEVDKIDLNSLIYQMTGSYDIDSQEYDLIFKPDGSSIRRPKRR